MITPNTSPFRPSTLAAREAASSTPTQRSNRGILSSPTTASLYSKDHDCSKINQENTYVKTTARCLFTIFRFYVSYAFSWTTSEDDSIDVPPLPKTEGEDLSDFSCTTSRGHTNFQGAQSHCKKLCQAAHSAITPNLHDNTYTLSRALIKAHPYHQLPVIQQMLVERCLRLTPSDIEKLNDPSQAKREEFLLRHTHPSFRLLHAGAFAANSVGYGRNATFEGPTSGNRIDCHLESILRRLEDELSRECTEGKKHPKAALQEFHAAYLVCLEELEKRLAEVSIRTAALQEAEADMEEAEARLENSLEKKDDLISINRDNYRDKVSKYLEHWECFF